MPFHSNHSRYWCKSYFRRSAYERGPAGSSSSMRGSCRTMAFRSRPFGNKGLVPNNMRFGSMELESHSMELRFGSSLNRNLSPSSYRYATHAGLENERKLRHGHQHQGGRRPGF